MAVVQDSNGNSAIVDYVVDRICLLGTEDCFDNLTCRLGFKCPTCPYNEMDREDNNERPKT